MTPRHVNVSVHVLRAYVHVYPVILRASVTHMSAPGRSLSISSLSLSLSLSVSVFCVCPCASVCLCVRVSGCAWSKRTESECLDVCTCNRQDLERAQLQDPKDGELRLKKAKFRDLVE